MRRIRSAWLALFWLALLPAFAGAAELVPLPGLGTRVTDLTGTLDATQRGRLEAQLAAIDRGGRAQIAVLLLPTTQPETIEQFGIRLAEAWKIGHKGADNGLIIIVAKNDRRMRIEVGYGLEGPIPDAVARRIIDERMAPSFKQGDFIGGLLAATEALNAILSGGRESLAPSGSTTTGAATNLANDHYSVYWIFALFFIGPILNHLLGILGSLVAGGLGGWLLFSASNSWVVATAAAVICFLWALPRKSSGRGSWSGGGLSSSGGGSSGGGFSGGGGGFGGGGSSGSW